MFTELYNTSTSTLPNSLPSYVAVSPPPFYSSDPRHGEQCIEHSPRGVASSAPTGIFIKKNGSVTVVLPDQEEGVSTPSYGRQGTIEGVLLLDKNEMVSQINIKLLGHLDYLNSDGGSKSICTLEQSVTLWTSDRTGQCPGSLPFQFTLPATYSEDNRQYPLPPSFAYTVPGVPDLVVTSVYALIVNVSYTRRVGFIPKTKCLRIPLRYHPRARPNRPIIPMPLFCSVKSSPEEWTQTMTTLKTKHSASDVSPIQSNFFVPSVQIFALSDVIPFHVQVSGQLSSLLSFFPKSSDSSSRVSVTILRQVSVEVRGARSWRSSTIGEAKIWPVPPTTSQLESFPSEGEVLDWEGEIQIKPDVTVGSFTASGVVVKDFILVTLAPPPSSPFALTLCHVPIRIVTDRWCDTPGRA